MRTYPGQAIAEAIAWSEVLEKTKSSNLSIVFMVDSGLIQVDHLVRGEWNSRSISFQFLQCFPGATVMDLSGAGYCGKYSTWKSPASEWVQQLPAEVVPGEAMNNEGVVNHLPPVQQQSLDREIGKDVDESKQCAKSVSLNVPR